MKMKKKLSSLFRVGTGNAKSFPVPFCYNAKTLSFRVSNDIIIKTMFSENNHVASEAETTTTPESWFTNSSEETASHSTESDQDLDSESVEMIIRCVIESSERLFFDPLVTTSSLLDKSAVAVAEEGIDMSPPPPQIEEISVAVAMESEDPYGDFRRSMEEMVRSNGELVKDWRRLEAMLAWYLKMNGRRSHGVIVSAFVDLLSGLSDSGGGGTSESGCYSTAVSSPV